MRAVPQEIMMKDNEQLSTIITRSASARVAEFNAAKVP